MFSETDYKRMYWHSRRGMLELDLILLPFVEQTLRTLDENSQQDYQRLLKEEDQDLYVWLIGKVDPPNEALQRMVALILRHRNAQAPSPAGIQSLR
ncbi:MAG: succinate dehydrogenase assembly factor 2 [Pseudomonadales bacterium]|nr:succinate dehydrogenase assembly factor 2 [Pseudomonadales bacterium]